MNVATLRHCPPPLAVLLCLLLASAGALAAYEEGEEIVVTGTVLDASGKRLPGLDILLEAIPSGSGMSSLGRPAPLRVTVRSDDQGGYRLTWGWNSRYKKFRLLAALPAGRYPGARLEVVESRDLTRQMRAGSPVVANLTVSELPAGAWSAPPAAAVETEPVETEPIEEQLASPPPTPPSSSGTPPSPAGSDDERRVYEEMGKPDTVKRADRAGHSVATWWYFERGRVYRFRDGRLESIDEFAPVEPF